MPGVACPRSGNRTSRPGSPGRTTSRTGRESSTRSDGSTPKSCARSPRHEHIEILCHDDAVRSRRGDGARPPTAWRRSAIDCTWCRPIARGSATRRRPACCARRAEPVASSCAGGSTPGPNTRTTRSTPRSARRWPRSPALPIVDAMRPDGGGPLVLEGGAIDTNGEGTAARHRRMPPVRGPGAKPRARHATDYETAFRDYLGVRETLWLGEGCAGDDTHGHIDDVARFVGARHDRAGIRGGSGRRKLRQRRPTTCDGSSWPAPATAGFRSCDSLIRARSS